MYRQLRRNVQDIAHGIAGRRPGGQPDPIRVLDARRDTILRYLICGLCGCDRLAGGRCEDVSGVGTGGRNRGGEWREVQKLGVWGAGDVHVSCRGDEEGSCADGDT